MKNTQNSRPNWKKLKSPANRRRPVKKKKRSETIATAVAMVAAAVVRVKEIAEIQIQMHTMQIEDWQKDVNQNHLEIGQDATMIDGIEKFHHNGIEIDLIDGPGHR